MSRFHVFKEFSFCVSVNLFNFISMWRFEMQFSTLFQKERKDEARVCYKEALR